MKLSDEYEMLSDELRQNRQIQLQSFFATPIWLGVFFGLLGSSDSAFSSYPELVLVPIPLIFINLLLFLDRRSSSDIIIAYFRTAIDQKLSEEPGWNLLLTEFRSNLNNLPQEQKSGKGISIRQRFDFNVIVWSSYFFVSLICCAVFMLLESCSQIYSIGVTVLVFVAYLLTLLWLFRQSAIKGNLIMAWEVTLTNQKEYRKELHNNRMQSD